MKNIEWYKKSIKELMDRKDELRKQYPTLFKDKSDYEMAMFISHCLKMDIPLSKRSKYET